MGPKTDDVNRIDVDETLEIEGEEMPSPTVQATRAQIEQTRGEMSGTIDAIRERLSTNTQSLTDQAKETVSDMASNVMDKARATVQDVVESAKSTMHDTMQEAKVAVHDTMQEAKEAVHDTMQEAKETLPALTSNAAHQAVSGAVTEAKEAMGSAVGSVVSSTKHAGATIVDTIRQNPFPAALLAIGLGWLWASQNGAGKRKNDWETRRYRSPYDESTWGPRSYSQTDVQSRQSYPATHVEAGGNPSSQHPNALSGAREAVGEVGERVSQAAGHVKESVGDLAGRVGGSVSSAAGQVGETVGHLGSRAGDYARSMASGCQTMLEERPLALGAIALGLGAAIGMLVPSSSQEDRWMGETRDQLVEKVGDTAQDLAMRAQIVAEEGIDSAKEEARKQGLSG